MRICLLVAACAALVATSASAQSGAPVTQVRMGMPPAPTRTGDHADLPLQLIEGLPTIMATVNGAGPFRFGIDTGAAGYLRVTPAVAQKLALTQIGEARASDPSGKNPVSVQLFEAKSLSFGDVSFAKVPTISLTMTRPGIDGIIGIGFFRDLLMTIDYPGLRFKAEKGSLPPANGRDIVDITLERGMIPTVPLKVGSWATAAHLDTGNTRYPFFVPTADVAALPTKGTPRAIGVAHTVSQELTLQAIDLTAPVTVGAVDLGVSSVGFPAAGPQSNIGSLALKNMTITIDMANQRARITPSH